MKIAIVGSGVSGLVAAHHLNARHEIALFEADDRLGGHTNTVEVEGGGRSVAVDTGFIVYNERNYPHFAALLRSLGVATQPSNMSFSVSDPATGLEYSSASLNSIFAQRRNLGRGSFLRLLGEILRFNRAVARVLSDHGDNDESLDHFVRRGRFSDDLVRQFLVPFGASLWSADPATFMEFPVRTYATFTSTHGMLDFVGRPRWRTVSGGARHYVDALVAPFRSHVHTNTPVRKIATGDGIELLTDHGPQRFDRVVVATHSDQALRLLDAPSHAEAAVLGAIRYQRNTVTLHRDIRMLPTNHRARASWNYRITGDARRATVTYWMNRLQSITTPQPLLITLNRRDEIDERTIFEEFEYEHPVFDGPAIRAQRRRSEIQGHRGVYFAGAYWGYGFHEDGVRSALDVVARIESEA